MPSPSLKAHNYWLFVLHDPKSTPEQRRVAQEFIDADKRTGQYQTKSK